MIPHKIKNFTLTLVILFSAIVLLLVTSVAIYKSQSIHTAKEISLILENALANDMSNRMVNPMAQDMTMSENAAEQYFHKRMQTHLLHKNPIHVSSLDSLFQQYLREKQIIAETAIRYIYELDQIQDTLDSKPNSTLYTNAYALPPILLGTKNEIIIQGHAKIATRCILHRGKKLFIIFGTLISLLAALLMYAAYRQMKQHHVPSTGLYKIDRHLTLNIDTLELQYKHQSVTLTPQSAQILKLFLEAPDHYLEYEELETLQWGNNHEITRRREQAIARLRTSLEEISVMHLISVWGSGNKLVIGSKWEAKRMEKFSFPYFKRKTVSFIKRFFVR